MHQVVERALANQQQGETVSKSHPVIDPAITARQEARARLGHIDQPHVLADKLTEPLRCGITGVRNAKGVAPDRDPAQIAVCLWHRDIQRRSPGRFQSQIALFPMQGRQLAHLRIRALGQEAAIVALH
ncbi:hypothetical protein D3C77_455010 [compost metagenome]